jgi:hypothetical protein
MVDTYSHSLLQLRQSASPPLAGPRLGDSAATRNPCAKKINSLLDFISASRDSNMLQVWPGIAAGSSAVTHMMLIVARSCMHRLTAQY